MQQNCNPLAHIEILIKKIDLKRQESWKIMKKLRVIPEKCIACGRCYLNFPQVFDCNDEGIAFVLPETSPLEHQKAKTAPYNCPTRAIIIEEALDDAPDTLRINTLFE